MHSLGRISRFAAVACALLLGGCFNSTEDIGRVLSPESPLPAGIYRQQEEGKGGNTIVLTREGGKYRMKDADKTYAVAFFKVPEYAGYVFQMTQHTGGATPPEKYEYVYARVEEGAFALYFPSKKSREAFPPYIKDLLGTNGSTITNGPRDTLYVLREVPRIFPTFERISSYRLYP